MNNKLVRRVSSVIILAIASIFGASQTLANDAIKPDTITVYKSATCSCCQKWVEHLEKNGFDVDAYNRKDMASIKQKLGISRPLQSCHTAVINGYIIEGHVPAADIKRLLAEKPDIKGLAVPNMPMGSPGMEGSRKDAYSVLAFDREGKTSIFNQY